MKSRFAMCVAILLLAVIVSGEAANQSLVDLPDQLLVESGEIIRVVDGDEREVPPPYFLKVEGDKVFVGDTLVYQAEAEEIDREEPVDLKQQLDDQAYSLYHQLAKENPDWDNQRIAQAVADSIYSRYPELYDWVKVMDGNIQVKDRDFPIPKSKIFNVRTGPPRTAEETARKYYLTLIKALQLDKTVCLKDGLIVIGSTGKSPTSDK